MHTASCLPRLLKAVALGITLSLAADEYFDCGSDGSDGALDYTGTPEGTTIEFDPASFTPALDADGDNVFHFTTITIPTGVTVKLRTGPLKAAPVYWLASGDVDISGTLDLGGDDGQAAGLDHERYLSVPGPGGWPGGPGCIMVSNNHAGQRGFGPGGGFYVNAYNGNFNSGQYHDYTNLFLRPLLGGSGGGGTGASVSNYGASGGAGAGAILLASSTRVIVNGSIRARGGRGGDGTSTYYGGSGGGIRVMAPVVTGGGDLDTARGSTYADNGRVRIEAKRNTFTGTLTNTTARVVMLMPNAVETIQPQPIPELTITTVDGEAVPLAPTGQFTPADVGIETGETVTLNISAKNVPVGKTVTLRIVNGTDGAKTVTSTALAGTKEASTATATTSFTHGFSRIYADVTWQETAR